MLSGGNTAWIRAGICQCWNERRNEEEKVIMVNDVARAFFEAPVKREICIELPEEDKSLEDMEKTWLEFCK